MMGSTRGALGNVRTARNTDDVPVGTSGPWPGFSAVAPPAIAAASSVGTSAFAAHADHTHAGVTSVNGSQGVVTVTAFPGFTATLPPAVAGASSAGAAATAARSDHTHALDIVAYPPSLAGMQAGGVVQQTYAAPTATPSVLTMAADQIPFGAHAATGLLAQDNRFKFNSANGRTGISSGNAFDVANAENTGQLSIIREAAGTQHLLLGTASTTAAVAGFIRSKRCRGTWAAPAAVAVGDTLLEFDISPHDGTSFVLPAGLGAFVPSDGTVAAGNVTVMFGFCDTATVQPARTMLGADTAYNVYAGHTLLTTAATDGFVYVPSAAGAFTGVPNIAFGTVRAQNRVPTGIDRTNRRSYAYIGGAWHFTAFDDYSATATRVPFGGATAGTLTDNAAMTYTVAAQSLKLIGTGGLTVAPLILDVGTLAGIGLSLTGGANTIDSTGDLNLVATTNFSTGGAGSVDLQVNSAHNLALGTQTTLATNATDGFPFIRTCAGTPTGVPAASYLAAGMSPFAYDTTNHKLWFYDGPAAAWKGVVLA
jgi:hypothetical protein